VIEEQWRRFRNGQLLGKGHVGEDILASWRRCVRYSETYQLHAPSDDPMHAEAYCEASPIGRALELSRSAIIPIAEEGDLVAAIADPSGCLIWTYASQRTRKRAEAIKLTIGSCWHERAVGTHAIGLALRLQRPATVFSCEHFQPFVHDWVSYAAPVLYPQSGKCAAILSLSTAWNRHTPLGQIAVTELARSMAQRLPGHPPKADLEIYALGQPRVVFRGRSVRLPLRQIEILCLLALNARGLNLDAFHTALYGDTSVSFSTLKAELSHLRRQLEGKIGSRPYRLQVPVWADFIEIWKALRRKKSDQAFSLYRGALLPESESPELEEWRRCIDAVMSQALGSCHDSTLLMDKLCSSTSGSDMVRERLFELMSCSGD
jgi:hypothetical protein